MAYSRVDVGRLLPERSAARATHFREVWLLVMELPLLVAWWFVEYLAGKNLSKAAEVAYKKRVWSVELNCFLSTLLLLSN